jgi:hypothetical protein
MIVSNPSVPLPSPALRDPVGAAVRDNLAALEQAMELLAGLDAGCYSHRVAACFNSTAGGHLRHVVEHYTSFLEGLGAEGVDYEARARDARIEVEPGYAVGRLEFIRDELNRLAGGGLDRGLRVRAETAGTSGETHWAESSVLRELEFLLSHTIHHFALIGVICGLLGQSLPKDFGMAPSTLRFLRARAA